MLKPIPIGIDDFRELRERGLEYIDKSHLIQELLDKPGVQVVLLPRPRRFGKTLNLSMLRYFFEKREEDLSSLFMDLTIGQAGEATRAHFQRYPVIHLTFKGVKAETWERSFGAIREKIIDAFDQHRYLLDTDLPSEVEVRRFRAILDGSASTPVYEGALLTLCGMLHRHHGDRAVILIDEYDAPIQGAWINGYAREAIAFFRAFLSEGLKGNPHLFKAVLTGVLRIAKESIFSGLNNLGVYSLLRPDFNTCFGFTESEVEKLLSGAGRADLLEPLRRWYDGYRFGGKVIYNPWSILSFLESSDKVLRSYWVSTSENDLIKDLLDHYALELERDIEILLEGGAVERRLDENVVLTSLRQDAGALYSLLVFSGYLKAEAGDGPPHEVPPYHLSIPNREVREVYMTTFRTWMHARLKGHGGSLRKLTSALLEGDAETFEEQLQAFTLNLLSYHDPATIEPEQVYHAFVVGLLAVLEPAYQVRSNRESGSGRPDVLILPQGPGKPAAVLELKVVSRKRSMQQALEEGLAQIRANDDGAELRAAGASAIHAFAVAFDGKSVQVRAAVPR